MNERIRELAEQAELAYAADVRAGFIYPTGTEKFAELIVKECAKRSGELGNPELGEGLMKHFGVE